jgi:hypothetical protein
MVEARPGATESLNTVCVGKAAHNSSTMMSVSVGCGRDVGQDACTGEGCRGDTGGDTTPGQRSRSVHKFAGKRRGQVRHVGEQRERGDCSRAEAGAAGLVQRGRVAARARELGVHVRARKLNAVSPGMGEFYRAMQVRGVHFHYVVVPQSRPNTHDTPQSNDSSMSEASQVRRANRGRQATCKNLVTTGPTLNSPYTGHLLSDSLLVAVTVRKREGIEDILQCSPLRVLFVSGARAPRHTCGGAPAGSRRHRA